MEDVRIYDYEFNLLHIEHDIVSCNWRMYENDIGNFEMHFPLESRLVQVAMENRYLVAVQGKKQAVITGRQVGTEGILYGMTVNWLLSRFCVCDGLDTELLAAKDAQSVCADILERAMAGVENFVFEEQTDMVFPEVALTVKGLATAFDLVQQVMLKAGGGHVLLFDAANKVWRFRLTQGKLLPFILSEQNRNCYDTEYTEDLQNYFVNGWYEQAMEDMGDWDANANNPRLVDSNEGNYAKAYRVTVAGKRFGIDFAEGDYIVCKHKEGTWEKAEKAEPFPARLTSDLSGIYAWEAVLSESTESEAEKELAGKRTEAEFAAKTTVSAPRWGKDYALGDSVRLEVKKGDFRTASVRKITGVSIWYENNDIGEEPIMEGAVR